MCFSATASFSAGIALTVVGAMTLSKSRGANERLLAAVPLLFAVQQFTEGFLWVALLQGKSAPAQYWLIHSYGVFVGIIWPLMIPAALYLIEPKRIRRRFILPILAVGAGVAVYTVRAMITSEINASIVNHCILYVPSVEPGSLLLISYVISTSAAFFCSSYRSIHLIGVMNLISFLIAYYYYEINFASGWCFFAAIVSGFIYLHLSHAKRTASEI